MTDVRLGTMPVMTDVRLRPWRASDARWIEPIRHEPHLRRWSSMGDDVGAWIERQRAGVRGPSRAICAVGDDRPLGKIALRLPGHASEATSIAAIRPDDGPLGELSYWVLPAARGRGVASAAVRAIASWAVEHTELHGLVFDIEASNRASQRLAERLEARRRSPTRYARDRLGERREMIVFVLELAR